MKVLYAGSFNPFHEGHQYVFNKACKYFGKYNVWLGCGRNPKKPESDITYSLYPITRNIVSYDGLTAKFAVENDFDLLIRGVRDGQSDEEDALTFYNSHLGMDTIYIPTPPGLRHTSSSAIRELHNSGSSVADYMNNDVFWRWKHQNYKFTIYFGKSCSGKSTRIKRRNKNFVEGDKLIWELTKNIVSPNLKQEMKEMFYKKDPYHFQNDMQTLGHAVNWENLFKLSDTFDLPVIGSYWNQIPVRIRTKAKLIKVITSEENRKIFAKKRNKPDNFLECADFFYQDPPYWDEEIIINKENK